MTRYLLIIFSVLVLCSMECSNHTTLASPETVVYVTLSGKKYHVESCRSLHNSKISISLSDAVNKGYTPCKLCHPPLMEK